MKKFFTLIVVAAMAFAAQANVLTVADSDRLEEQCAAPDCAYSFTAPGRVVVHIINREPGAIVYYWGYKDGVLFMNGSCTDVYTFEVSGIGQYMVHAVAKMPGKSDSNMGGLEFMIIEDPQPQSLRGDVNGDGFVNIADVTDLINYLLTDDATGINLENANCNNDQSVNIADVTDLINFLLTDAW